MQKNKKAPKFDDFKGFKNQVVVRSKVSISPRNYNKILPALAFFAEQEFQRQLDFAFDNDLLSLDKNDLYELAQAKILYESEVEG